MSANIADRFEQAVDTHPTRIAVDTGSVNVSFAELDARANRRAHWLTSIGVGLDDLVGVALYNRIAHIEMLLAAFKIRAVPVNVNCQYTAGELAGLLGDASHRVVAHEPELNATLEAAGVQDHVVLDAEHEACLADLDSARSFSPRQGTDRYIIYTGGTTGTPKGVLWHHEDLIAAVLEGPDLDGAPADAPQGRVLAACPFTHGTAQWTVLSALLHGSTIVLGQPCGLDAPALWSRVEDAAVTRLVVVGDAFARPLLDALDGEPERWDLSSLVAITSGGARWSIATQQGLLEHLPHVAMVNSFGASETGGQGTLVTFAGQYTNSPDGLFRIAVDGTSTVLDDMQRPVLPGSGVVGRLARSGPIPQGYSNDATRTAEVFPLIDGVRYAIPGDLASVDDDGTIVVLGRDRNVINTGGEKVFAEEVESRLVHHPAVADAVVVGVPDDRWGECIKALALLHPNASVTEAELTDHCSLTLARFKVPRHIAITDTIHYLPNGKLDRGRAADIMCRVLS